MLGFMALDDHAGCSLSGGVGTKSGTLEGREQVITGPSHEPGWFEENGRIGLCSEVSN